jgi:hypothetical protein
MDESAGANFKDFFSNLNNSGTGEYSKGVHGVTVHCRIRELRMARYEVCIITSSSHKWNQARWNDRVSQNAHFDMERGVLGDLVHTLLFWV